MDNKKLKSLTLCEIRAKLAQGEIALQDLDTATIEKLLDRETALLCVDEGDTDFINECAKLLCETKQEIMPHERFVGVIHDTFEKHVSPPKKRLGIKKMLIIAAVISTLIVGGTVVVSSLDNGLYGIINKTARQPDGTTFAEGDFTFYSAGICRQYKTLEEAVEKERVNIMCPTSLPEGVVIKEVHAHKGYRCDKSMTILTQNEKVCILVDVGLKHSNPYGKNNEIYTSKNGIDYVIRDNVTALGYKYSAYATVDNCGYVIQVKEYEDMIYIIEHMEHKNEANS